MEVSESGNSSNRPSKYAWGLRYLLARLLGRLDR